MVGTRHCCLVECKIDSRYPEKWPESLKELEVGKIGAESIHTGRSLGGWLCMSA